MLIKSCFQGTFNRVKWLLDDKRLDADDDVLDHCLEISVRKGFTEIVELFLRDGRADPNGVEHLPLKACQDGHFEIARMLFEDKRVHVHGDTEHIDEVARNVADRAFREEKQTKKEERIKIYMLLSDAILYE